VADQQESQQQARTGPTGAPLIPAAVLFDCDGVIVDSEPVALALVRQDLAKHGLRLTPDEMAQNFVGGTMQGDADRARAMGADLPESWVDDIYVRLYAQLAKGIPLIPGIAAVMDALDAAGIPYAVGSNGAPRKMQITLGQHPEILARLHGRLYSGQALGCTKPDPGLYLYAARALGVDRARAVVVEDSATGCIAAARAGMVCSGSAAHDDGARLAAEGAIVFHDMGVLPGLMNL